MTLRVNYPGWVGFILFAAIGLSVYIYTFLPITNCYAQPLYCFAMVHVYYFPLGVAGFFVFSHYFRPRTVQLFLLILLILGIGVAGHLPQPIHAQGPPNAGDPTDYYPFTYWTDTPQNVSYATKQFGEYFTYQWVYFWNYHPISLANTCAANPPVFDYELFYVYVDIATQQLIGVAYRFHCNWTFHDVGNFQIPAVKCSPCLQIPGINATRPVLTFLTNFHVPVNAYPNSTTVQSLVTSFTDLQGRFVYLQQNYNYTKVANVSPNAQPIDPRSLLNTNYVNVEALTIAGFIIWPAVWVVFFAERRKIAKL